MAGFQIPGRTPYFAVTVGAFCRNVQPEGGSFRFTREDHTRLGHWIRRLSGNDKRLAKETELELFSLGQREIRLVSNGSPFDRLFQILPVAPVINRRGGGNPNAPHQRADPEYRGSRKLGGCAAAGGDWMGHRG